MKYIKLFVKWMLAMILSCIFCIALMLLVAYWMQSGGWNYKEHEVFFWVFTLVPSVLLHVGLVYELIIAHRRNRIG